MALGILNNISAIYAQNNLNNTQASLQKVLQQLSSGSRINSGADDAAGLAIANGLKANENALTQSTQNASDAIGLLSTADGALSQVTSLLNRAVTLATESANGTLSGAQVSAANVEYQSIITEIGNIGSTTNFNGNNVFTGTATNFYVGDGTTSGSNNFSDTTGVLTTTSVGVAAPTTVVGAAPAFVATSAATGTYTFTSANDTVSGTLSTHDATGPLDSAITFTAGTTLQEAVNQINASTGAGSYGANGVLATLTGGKTIVLTKAASVLTDGTQKAVDTQGSVALSGTSSAAGPTPTVSFALLTAADTIQGSLTLSGGTSPTLSLQFAPGTTGAAAALQINSNNAFASAGFSATFTAGGKLVITGATQTAGSYAITTTSTLTDGPALAGTGVGANFSNSQLTTAQAGTVLTLVNAAIANVSYQRGILGAYSNQLTAASNTAASENVNLTSAESSIRSTNYGDATSNLAKFEVLSQTGISALAQANTVQQEILKLLQ